MSSTRASGDAGAPRDMACAGVPSSGSCRLCPAGSAARAADARCSAASSAALTQRGRPRWGPECSGLCFDKQAPQAGLTAIYGSMHRHTEPLPLPKANPL